MPSEKPPTKPRKYKVVRGDQTWVIDPEEQRIEHDAVDENGIRHTKYSKGSNKEDTISVINRYRRKKKEEGLDYAIVENEYEIDFQVSESSYLTAEAKRHDAAIKRSKPFSQDRELIQDGIDAKFEELQSMSPSDFANLSAD